MSIQSIEIDLDPNINLIIGKCRHNCTVILDAIKHYYPNCVHMGLGFGLNDYNFEARGKAIRDAIFAIRIAYYHNRQINPETEKPTILIELPELGLHPHAFNDVCGAILEEMDVLQFIIYTNSAKALDIFVGEDDLDRILITSYHGQKGVKLNRIPQSEQEWIRQNMDDVWLSQMWHHFNYIEKHTYDWEEIDHA